MAVGTPIRRRRADEGVVVLNDLTVDAAYEALLRRCGLDSLDALFAVREAESLAKPGLDTWRERLRLRLPCEEGERVLYLKRFHQPPASARRAVRRARIGARSCAGVEWGWLRRVSGDGIACPKPVALGEQCHRGREVRSAVLMSEAPGRSLEALARNPGAPGQVDRSAVAQLVAEAAARFHGQGYVHRDFYLSHWFFDPSEDGGGLYLIDLQRVLRPPWRLRRWVVKDLAALNFSTPSDVLGNAARVRWLICYLKALRGQPCAERIFPDIQIQEPARVESPSGHPLQHNEPARLPSARGRRINGSVRRLIYQIVGKTQRISRHHARKIDSLRRGTE